MTTIAHPGAYAKHIARQKAHHRRAFGPHRARTPEQRARHIAESIALRLDEGGTWTYSDYGLDTNVALRGLVFAALAALDSEGEPLDVQQLGLADTEPC